MIPAHLSTFKRRKKGGHHLSLARTWRAGSCSRRKLGRHVFSQLPFPMCRSSLAPSLCPQPALDIQSGARRCCRFVHGPYSGINICSPVQFQTSFHCPTPSVQSFNLLWAWPEQWWSPALYCGFHTMARYPELCHHAPQLWARTSFLRLRPHLGRSLTETIISAKRLPEGICYEKVLCDFGVIFIELLLWGNAAIPVLSF